MQGKTRNAFGIIAMAATAVLSTASITRASLLAYENFGGDATQTAVSSASPTEGTGGTDPFTGTWTGLSGGNTPSSNAYVMNSPGSPEPSTTEAAQGFNNFTGAYRELSSSISSGTLYMSFLMNDQYANGSGYADDIFLQGGTAGTNGNYVLMIGTGYNSGSNDWGFQVRTSSNSGISTTTGNAGNFEPVSGASVTPGTTALLVVALQYTGGTTDSVTMWVDPTSTNPASAPYSTTLTGTATNSVTLAPVNAVEMYAGSHGTSVGTVSFSNIALGTTFADVVPEPASLGLLALSAGAMCMRRRRGAGSKMV